MLEVILYLLIGLTAGVVSGLIGIGGGVIIVPSLIFLFGMTQHQAQGTSLAMLLPPIGALAVWNYWKAGYINWTIALIAATGFFFGGYIGANFANSISNQLLRKIFGVALLAIAVYMIVK
uniref:Probable membrane transporter protein n=1 Tax=uncultured euryarchaeote Alv-FOS5 TaxID=337891 RepID=Q3SBB3_9EURY|nr:predicted permease [uncultured euryarchaeote Alv-FOS5]